MLRIWKFQTFVAVDPKAPLGRNVVGYVESTAEYPLPLCIETTLSDKEKRGMVIYILRVKVREDWQNKKVGTMMLPRALKNVSTGQDNAVATSSVGVHLRVEGTNDHAIKLYEKFNFTYVGVHSLTPSSLIMTLIPVPLYQLFS
ncbi:hypothetical protein FOZ63_022218 [Perkinsus olseni]|uniref:N-acetyltransferase domain-containing protein n=1 Tax=Perkinsus olseni TaxID=32597 RepID=A0A7J6PU21_PEROL|nr:hypothetical protein FOZ63_022218 [Perkinsus olseni]